MFLICLCVFLYSGYQLFGIFMEYKQGTDVYTEASSNVTVEKDDDVVISPIVLISDEDEDNGSVDGNTTSNVEDSKEDEAVTLDVDWSKFNDNVIGWIKVENSKIINYPIIQSYDNEYYLTHLYNGKYNSAGSIFVDYRNDGLSNRHIIIYGHNMKNGSMFNTIKKYRDQSFADEHRYIYIAEPDGSTRVFYVYSCHLTDALGDEDFNAYQVSFDGDEWSDWIQKTIDKSLITTNIEIPDKATIITLSTCMSRGVQTERCVVHAVEIQNK